MQVKIRLQYVDLNDEFCHKTKGYNELIIAKQIFYKIQKSELLFEVKDIR